MQKNLVIVESPAKAKTIEKFLGPDYKVMSSYGHICDLKKKDLSIDIDTFEPIYEIPTDKKKVVSELKEAASKAQMVWLASDEDREGEAISWHLYETLGLKPQNTKRIVFHEITKDAILNAIETPRDIDTNLVYAQQARRVMDRLVGFELSPILWRKIQRGLSAGRVQSVALRLIVDREREILSFQSEPYYKVDAVFNAGGVKVKGSLDTRFKTIEEARAFLNDSIGAQYEVASVEKKEGVRIPAPPFTTSTLQQEASRKLHFSVSNTMRVAQSLYERGLITYMRTDSTNLSTLALGTAKQFILDNFGPEYQHTRQYKTHTKGAQEAHEAIRPTYIANTDIEGTADEKKLYQLIWKRTLACQMSEARVMSTNIKVASDKRPEKYAIQASEILFDGFLKIYMEGTDDEQDIEDTTVIPEVHEGDILQEKGITAECKFTLPPFRYSEATLVKKLEELGIGRPSTYAPTITTLTTGRGYIAKGNKEGSKVTVTNLALKGGVISENAKTETVGAEKGKLLPQEIGIIVTDFLMDNFDDIMDYDFTANVEKTFDSIADGNTVWNDVISTFYGPFHKKVEATLTDGQFSHVERVLGVDPADGEQLVAKFGQYGPYVQKGDGEKKQFASLAKGQLIESITLEDAIKLFDLPRTVGQLDGTDIVVLKGRFGPYIKHGERNVALPKGSDPLKIGLEACIALIQDSAAGSGANAVIKEFKEKDFSILNGRYGPYIKHAGSNYKIPSGTEPSALTEDKCKEIIAGTTPSAHKFKRYKKK